MSKHELPARLNTIKYAQRIRQELLDIYQLNLKLQHRGFGSSLYYTDNLIINKAIEVLGPEHNLMPPEDFVEWIDSAVERLKDKEDTLMENPEKNFCEAMFVVRQVQTLNGLATDICTGL